VRQLFLRLVWTCVLPAVWTTAAYAQAPTPSTRPPLVTDRPDFTESSDVIPGRWLQFEGGVTVAWEGSGVLRTRSVTAPAALFRLGLGFHTELRIGAEGYVNERSETQRTAGYSDVELGAKVWLLQEGPNAFDLSVIPIVSFPAGDAALSSQGVDPTVKVTWSRGLPAGFSLAGNLNFSWITEGGSHFSQQALSLSVNHDIGRGWGGYLEVYRFSRMTRTEGAGNTVNGGVSRQFAGRVQIDMEAGRGLTREAPDWFVGAGLALLLPSWKQ
jgi:hypothetical protein